MGLHELLATTIVLTGGHRVKMLPLTWTALSDAERTLALHTVREAVTMDLEAHPEATLHLEVSELPEDLRETLDRMVQWSAN